MKVISNTVRQENEVYILQGKWEIPSVFEVASIIAWLEIPRESTFMNIIKRIPVRVSYKINSKVNASSVPAQRNICLNNLLTTQIHKKIL